MKNIDRSNLPEAPKTPPEVLAIARTLDFPRVQFRGASVASLTKAQKIVESLKRQGFVILPNDQLSA